MAGHLPARAHRLHAKVAGAPSACVLLEMHNGHGYGVKRSGWIQWCSSLVGVWDSGTARALFRIAIPFARIALSNRFCNGVKSASLLCYLAR